MENAKIIICKYYKTIELNQAWNSDVFGSGDNPLRARTVFALAWFHAVVQERRIFIPQGWCKFYEFSDSDLKAGLQVQFK